MQGSQSLLNSKVFPSNRQLKNLNRRDYIVTSNQFVQASGASFKPIGRMFRTDRFKYSIYDSGKHRESLIDMQKDPREMTNLARNPEYQSTLKLHQKILKEYAEKNGD